MKRSELKDLIRKVIEESADSNKPAYLPFTIYDSEGVPQESFATREDAEAILAEWEADGEDVYGLEIVEESYVTEGFKNNPNIAISDIKPVLIALKVAFKDLTEFVADNDLEEDISDEYPFALSLDDMSAEVSAWVDYLLK